MPGSTPPREIVEGTLRKITYSVAMSLDGFISGPAGEVDWITLDPDIDFEAFHRRFDTVLIGRRTYEFVKASRNVLQPGTSTFVFSRTLKPHEYPGVTIVSGDLEKTVTALRAEPGRGIWLTGGASLFRSLAELKLVDSMEVTIIPVLLGGGTPLIAQPCERIGLTLKSQKVFQSGLIALEYALRN